LEIGEVTNFSHRPAVSDENSRVWSTGKETDVKPSCLLVKRLDSPHARSHRPL